MNKKKVLCFFVLLSALLLGRGFFVSTGNADENISPEFRPQKHFNKFEVRQRINNSDQHADKLLVYIFEVPVFYFDGKNEISYGSYIGETRISKVNEELFKAELYCGFRLSKDMNPELKVDEVYVTASFDNLKKDSIEDIKNENLSQLVDHLAENLNQKLINQYNKETDLSFSHTSRELIKWFVGSDCKIFSDRVIRAVTLYDETSA